MGNNYIVVVTMTQNRKGMHAAPSSHKRNPHMLIDMGDSPKPCNKVAFIVGAVAGFRGRR